MKTRIKELTSSKQTTNTPLPSNDPIDQIQRIATALHSRLDSLESRINAIEKAMNRKGNY